MYSDGTLEVLRVALRVATDFEKYPEEEMVGHSRAEATLWLLLGRMTKTAFPDGSAERARYERGGEEYKQRWGEIDE